MNKIADKVMSLRFRQKLLLSFCVIAILPLILYFSIYLYTTTNQITQTTIESTNQMADNVSKSMDIYITSIDKQADLLIAELKKNDYLNEENWMENEPKINEWLITLQDLNAEIAGIILVTDYDTYTSYNLERNSKDALTEETWYKSGGDQKGISILPNMLGRNVSYIANYNDSDTMFSLVKGIFDHSGNQVGTLMFDIKTSVISNTIGDITIGNNGFIFITDRSGEMIYTPTNEIVYRIHNEDIQNSLNSCLDISILNHNYKITSSDSEYSNWITTGVISGNDIQLLLMQDFEITMIYFALWLLLIILLSLSISNGITKPIGKLKTLMAKATNGDLNVRFNSNYHDEIGELGNAFDHMIAQINTLIKKVYDVEQSKRVAELKSLQEQIKPHFLYNTLDTISWMAREKHAPEIVALVDALTNMFRTGLSQGRDYITLEEEINHVSNYLYIQSVRYGDRMTYEVNTSPNIHGIIVPKLILQPLVENAIYHGIKLKSGHRIISVSTIEEEEDVLIKVADDGAGITDEKLLEINTTLKSDVLLKEKRSFGVYYIKDRLQLCFGDSSDFWLEQNEDGGVTSVVRIPKDSEHQITNMMKGIGQNENR